MKAMMHFKNVCVANKHTPKVLFYDGHGSYFDCRAVNILLSHHIKPFILKEVDSENGHSNDDVPNIKLKGLYVQYTLSWQRKRGTP